MLVKLDHFPKVRGENKKSSKPPPSGFECKECIVYAKKERHRDVWKKTEAANLAETEIMDAINVWQFLKDAMVFMEHDASTSPFKNSMRLYKHIPLPS